MIRINLLEVRPRSGEGLDVILRSGKSSTFISRREAVLGGLFLALTIGILSVLATRLTPDGGDLVEDAVVAAEEAPASNVEVAPPQPDVSGPAAPDVVEEPAPEAPAPEPPVPSPPQPRQDPPPARAAAQLSGSERAITMVTATPLADRVDIFLEMANAPTVTRLRVNDPPRLVFDIPMTQLLTPDSQRIQRVDSPLVNRIRIAQYTLEPPVVRLVLETSDARLNAEVLTSAAGLSIRVTETAP